MLSKYLVLQKKSWNSANSFCMFLKIEQNAVQSHTFVLFFSLFHCLCSNSSKPGQEEQFEINRLWCFALPNAQVTALSSTKKLARQLWIANFQFFFFFLYCRRNKQNDQCLDKPMRWRSVVRARINICIQAYACLLLLARVQRYVAVHACTPIRG